MDKSSAAGKGAAQGSLPAPAYCNNFTQSLLVITRGLHTKNKAVRLKPARYRIVKSFQKTLKNISA